MTTLEDDTTIGKLKADLRGRGFSRKALVSDKEMTSAKTAFYAQDGVIDTPSDELRYIEGLLGLSLRSIDRFSIVPAVGHEKCACGRTPSALDIVATAVNRQIHDTRTMRDAVIGVTNMIELADEGRVGDCVACGRLVVSAGYFTHSYMYA
ncbi:hypothetical protein [Pseudonocardia xishanensis]|uniref:Uncharacterized protein n=1 Tax=Pseudonocardia xishanensis TaxID=630995 RepID=A0ABP8S626_9PSEU